MSTSSNNTSTGGNSKKKAPFPNTTPNNMSTITEAAEHLKVPTCGGNMAIKQKKRTNLKVNNRSTPDPFEGPSTINPSSSSSSKMKPNTKINNSANVRKAKTYPQIPQHQQQQSYYDPRYSSQSGQYWPPYENTYTTYDYPTTPEEYWIPSQNYFTDYQPSYHDYQRQTTNSTDSSIEYQQQPTNNENQPDISDYQQVSSNDNLPPKTDNNYPANTEYQREPSNDAYPKQESTEYYEDEGYVEKRSESPESNKIQQHDGDDQLRQNDHHDDDMKQYIC